MRSKYHYLLALILVFITSSWSKGQKIEYIKVPELEKILKAPENKLFVVNFWATWCAPCVNELPGFEKVAKEYDFPYLYDESQVVGMMYGATNTPHAYVLSKKDGKLEVQYVGAIDNNADNPKNADKKYVEDAVNALLKGEQVPITSTKAVGCGIKWKKV
jgi:thiol-disulfide isomerase/thioredoxin